MCLVLHRGSPVTQPTQSFSSPQLHKLWPRCTLFDGTTCLSPWEGRAGRGWHLAFEGVKEEAQALRSLAVPAGEAPRTLLEAFAHKPYAQVVGGGEVSSFSSALVMESLDILCQDVNPLWGQIYGGKQGPSRQGADDRAFCSVCSTSSSSTHFSLHFNTTWGSSNPSAHPALPLWKTSPILLPP